MRQYQDMQLELDNYIIESKGITVCPDVQGVITESELLKNMMLACLDEIEEAYEDPDDLEELVDIAHFILSIANKFHETLSLDGIQIGPCDKEDHLWIIRCHFMRFVRMSRVFKHWSDKPGAFDRLSLEIIMARIIASIEASGGDFDTLYRAKYEKNKARQQRGY